MEEAEIINMHEEIQILHNLGYKVKLFTQFHYRINDVLDVWPTAKYKKFMQINSGEKGIYEKYS